MSKSIRPILIISTLLLLLSVLLFGLGSALPPLLFSFAISYLFFPLVMKLEKKGMKRNYVISLIFLLLIIVLCLAAALVLPALIDDIQAFFGELPANVAKAFQKIESIAKEFGYNLNLNKETILVYIKSNASKLADEFLNGIAASLKISVKGISSWIINILNIFLIPLFFFYLMSDYEKIINGFQSYIPRTILPKLQHYFSLSNEVISGYIRGQLMVALILGILYATGLWLVGLRFGLLIGFISGLISIIPYAGFTIGFATAIIVALADYSGAGQVIGIVGVFSVVQTAESFYITPKIVGDKVGLSSLATILALIIGGNLLGLIGMLIAIPTAAICKTLITDLKAEFHQLDLFTD